VVFSFQLNGEIHGTWSPDEKGTVSTVECIADTSTRCSFRVPEVRSQFHRELRRECKIKFITCVQDLVHHLHNPALDFCNEKKELILFYLFT
jgi:hypothetical protein